MSMSASRWLLATITFLVSLPVFAGLPEIVASTKPSVLAVGQWNLTSSPRFTFRGTGFVVGDGNQVITNAHVLPPSADLTFGNELRVRIITGADAGTERVVTVVNVDRARDLAHLRMAGPPLPALSLAGPELMAEGSSVAFIGFPIGGLLGMAHVTHRGIVSSVTSIVLPPPNASALTPRAISQIRDGAFTIYQLDGTAYPGNSGGPVLDTGSGKVVGVINMVLIKGTRESSLSAPSGITYAIPIRFVRELLESK